MVSLLGAVLANTFLSHLEDTVISRSALFPDFYVRYLDDTFCVFSDESHVHQFLNFLNSVHPNLRFTVEEEVSGKLPFLDISVERKGSSSELSVYRKSVFKGLYFHFSSFIPSSYKTGLISTTLSRSFKIGSTWKLFTDEVEIITGFLKKNGFPSHMSSGRVCVSL